MDEIYKAYPKDAGKRPALKAIAAAVKRIQPGHSPEWLLGWVRAYAECRRNEDQRYTPLPAKWFNEDRFHDELHPPQTVPQSIDGVRSIAGSPMTEEEIEEARRLVDQRERDSIAAEQERQKARLARGAA